jgi:hypothetical protein
MHIRFLCYAIDGTKISLYVGTMVQHAQCRRHAIEKDQMQGNIDGRDGQTLLSAVLSEHKCLKVPVNNGVLCCTLRALLPTSPLPI